MANKTKLRFNGIDLLIVIIFIGCLAGLVLRYQLIDVIRNSGDDQSAKISFYLSNIKETSEDFFAEGDVFFIAGSDERLGALQSGFVFEPAEEFHMAADGTLVKSASVNGRSDMRGVIEANGIFSDEGFLLNNTQYIAPGSKISIYSGKIEVTITVTNVEKTS